MLNVICRFLQCFDNFISNANVLFLCIAIQIKITLLNSEYKTYQITRFINLTNVNQNLKFPNRVNKSIKFVHIKRKCFTLYPAFVLFKISLNKAEKENHAPAPYREKKIISKTTRIMLRIFIFSFVENIYVNI